ncbi:MAG: 16S rRNA (guanine(527)-N(7))-methyltransferase RsmG [Corallococcus sp.]|nr:16S rRNA (guanine(527)-N(7))-methyltransferase RsmG [Corallococcus sp.]
MIKDYIFNQTNISLDENMLDRFSVYCSFLQEENEKYNLTSITDTEEIWIKHFADSILGAVAIPQASRLCDVGSGAGFPSIPLKIARPDIDVTLVDSLEKRINFTKALTAKIGISANFFHARAEDFAKSHAESFDVATARAVAPLAIMLEYVAQIVKIGGIVLAYKTDVGESALAENACKLLGLRFDGALDFTLPDDSKRCLLVYRKTAHTPSKYPRGQNKPRKQPL